ncbi:MAG: hypothetical protein FDX18_07150 [Chlorobium sp.]|nr:MAG: hypothetical protein FDX18_07150 [Chlorobium sp.]
MKTTSYFNFTRSRSDRAGIKEEWICFVVENPEKTVIQSDGRIKKWAHIQEAGKVLRVILLEDGETVHNAFFDRSYKED